MTNERNIKFRRMSKTSVEPIELLRTRFRVQNLIVRNFLAEFIGTFLLLFVGVGIVAQHLLTESKLNIWLNINFGFGFLISLIVYATFHTSGGHFNPAVSVAFYTIGKMNLVQLVSYIIAQVLGAYLGAAGAYVVYYDEIQHFAGDLRTVSGPKATAGLFTSFPKPHLSHCTMFLDQFVGTALLLFFVLVIVDHRNKIPVGIQPLLIGLVLFVIGCSYGMNLGYPINPARDFGPRLFALTAGYGWEVFSIQNYYSWIPVFAPLLGGPFGVWTYVLFLGLHNSDVVEKLENKKFNETNIELEPLSDKT